MQLNIPLFHSATGQQSFHYRTVVTWNSIDKESKFSKKAKDFKEILKKKLLLKFLDQD